MKRMVADLNMPTAPKSKGKQKFQSECDDYIPENEDEDDSDDTTEV